MKKSSPALHLQLKFLLHLYQSTVGMIVQGRSVTEILEAITLNIEEHLNRRVYCSVLLMNESDNRLKLGYAPNLQEFFTTDMIETNVGPEGGYCGRAAYYKTSVIVPDILQDKLHEKFHSLAQTYQLRACWSIPIMMEGRLLGVFSVYHAVPSHPTAFELEMIETCAHLAGLAIERERKEQEFLATTEAKFQMIAEHTSDTISVLNRDGTVVYASPANEFTLGYSQAEYQGLCVFDLVHPDDLSHVRRSFRRMADEKNTSVVEFRYRHKQGHFLIMEVKGKPVIQEDGQVQRFVVVGRDVTSRRVQEQKLEESEQRYKSLFENNPDGVFSLSLEGEIFSHNTSLERILGYSSEELLGDVTRVIAPECLTTTMEHFSRAVQGEPQTYETLAVHKLGYRVPVQVTNIPIVVGGQIVGVFGIAKDITEQKTSQEALRTSEEQLRLLIHTIPDIVLVKDAENRLLEINQAALDIFGMDGLDYRGRDFLELAQLNEQYKELYLDCHYSDREAWMRVTPQHFEYEVQKPDGTSKVYDILKSSHFDGKGVPKHLVTIGRDITVRKSMETELRQMKEQLESLFQHSADGIAVLDIDRRFIRVNRAMELMFGWKAEELSDNCLVPDHLRMEAADLKRRVLSGEELVGIETVRKHKDGHHLEVSNTYSPIRDHQGEVVAFSVISRDISGRKQTEELLRRSDKLAVIGQLAAAVAHEIRNPLTSIKGFIQLFQDRIDSHFVGIMLDELKRIETIITEFLSLAKPQVTNFEPRSITKLIKDTLSIIETQALMDGIEIQLETSGMVPIINCDEYKIKQVLINILKNAMEAMPKGGKIYISLSIKGEQLVIQVRDEGHGIPADRMPHLGEPFYSHKEKGTGLGLMVSFKIIEEHRGRIQIQSECNKGTTVDIILPMNLV
ncbi:PAS domain S-box protein [Ammoniphilus sp. CFH 90114]|uniref:PAS domain S-box protein n=1 Tax=Ammoniphilus sp. CFH 90114 TaxID=2493665 RepID=UPI00100E0AEB|nr:PAS domain S-box protein [Ammoniphilus sp. CFH 90114]RXT15476.1 PAS domain S-box protein [Ammoniphilus sp. CFH 90114]